MAKPPEIHYRIDADGLPVLAGRQRNAYEGEEAAFPGKELIGAQKRRKQELAAYEKELVKRAQTRAEELGETYTTPKIHRGRTQASDYYIEALTKDSLVRRIVKERAREAALITTNNTKIKKLGEQVAEARGGKVPRAGVFSIPAGITCIGAGECVFMCYAEVGRFANVSSWELKTGNWFASFREDFVSRVVGEVRDRLDLVRVHDSGDFYNEDYLAKWIDIANECPETTFYGYTKSVLLMKGAGELPPNFKFVYSWGSTTPNWAAVDLREGDRIALIVAVNPLPKEERELDAEGTLPDVVDSAKIESHKACEALVEMGRVRGLETPGKPGVPLFVDGTFSDAPAAIGEEQIILLGWHGGTLGELDGIGISDKPFHRVPMTGQKWTADREWTDPNLPYDMELVAAPPKFRGQCPVEEGKSVDAVPAYSGLTEKKFLASIKRGDSVRVRTEMGNVVQGAAVRPEGDGWVVVFGGADWGTVTATATRANTVLVVAKKPAAAKARSAKLKERGMNPLPDLAPYRAWQAARRLTLQIESEHEANPTRENEDRLDAARVAEGKAYRRLEAFDRGENPSVASKAAASAEAFAAGRGQNPMKMPKAMFERLRRGPVGENMRGTTTRERWDVLWENGGSEIVKEFYAAGLNDDHIDTALKMIQGQAEGRESNPKTTWIVTGTDGTVIGIFTLPAGTTVPEAKKFFVAQLGKDIEVRKQVTHVRGTRTKMEELRAEMRRRARGENPRKRNASETEAVEQADAFINGKSKRRNPLKTRPAEAVVMKSGVALGKLVAFDYDKNRPGVKGSWFIHEIERAKPTVFIAPGKGLKIEPTEEADWIESGANAATISASKPRATGARALKGHVADGGVVNKIIVEVNHRIFGFRYAEIAFAKNQRPTLDFTKSLVSLSFTRSQWAALPANKRVFFQYRGKNPTGSAGHEF